MNLDFERTYWRNQQLVVGIDEVGRGCLAGPVVVGAVVFPVGHELIEGIADSKMVPIQRRELLEPIIRDQALFTGIGRAEAEEIDAIGIVAAINKAADAALRSLNLEIRYMIVSDGPRPIHSPIDDVGSEAVINGDASVYSIAAASIMAKVYRDRLMNQYAITYPGYGWEKNVGYGTRQHISGIDTQGLTVLHRRTFCSNLGY
jgi:ribonuclease HII